MKQFCARHKRGLIVAGAGVIFLFFYYLPYMILGENSYILVFDNLDSEIMNNVLGAKYFFQFTGTIPELINIDVRAINVFAPIQLIFYAIFPPLAAFMISDIIVRATAFVGMYLLMDLIFKNKYQFISIATAIMFSCIQFFTIYGLTGAGIPILIWAFINIYKKKNLIASYLCVVFYAVSSSIFLSGWVVLGILFCVIIYLLITRKKHGGQKHFYIATALMLGIYLVLSFKVIWLMLSGFESHRVMWNDRTIPMSHVVPQLSFAGMLLEFIEVFFMGHYHLRSVHPFLVGLCFIALIIGFVLIRKYKKRSQEYQIKKYWTLLWVLVVVNAVVAFFAAFAKLRLFGDLLSILKLNFFDFARVYHVSPAIWYVSAGLAFLIFYDFLTERISKKAIRPVALSVIVFFAIIQINVIFTETFSSRGWNYYTNVGAVVGIHPKNYPTYAQFYDTELYDSIDKYIKDPDNFGLTKDKYKVGSIGLHPTMATYNGFYTIDGYVQNYSLDYWKLLENISIQLIRPALLNNEPTAVETKVRIAFYLD